MSKDKSMWSIAVATAAGIAAVAIGWLLSDQPYLPDLLLNLGSSLVLVVPLYALGSVLERRIKQADARVAAVTTRLDEIGDLTRQRLRQDRSNLDDTVTQAETVPTQPNIAAMLLDAIAGRALAPDGVRVRLVGPLRLRVAPVELGDGSLRLTVEQLGGSRQAALNWPPQQSAAEFGTMLARALDAIDSYPGDDEFDVTALIRQLIASVRAGVKLRDSGATQHYGALVEVVNPQWAITQRGLCRLDRTYGIEDVDLDTQSWPDVVATLDGVNAYQFEEAYRAARALLLR